MISIKSLASCSDNARIFLRSSLDNNNDRNNSTNSSDPGLSDGRKCSPGGTLFENSGAH